VLQREISLFVEICTFGRIRCIAPKYDRIIKGGSKVPHRWFIDLTQVGPISQRNFLHSNFQSLLEIKSYWFFVCG